MLAYTILLRKLLYKLQWEGEGIDPFSDFIMYIHDIQKIGRRLALHELHIVLTRGLHSSNMLVLEGN